MDIHGCFSWSANLEPTKLMAPRHVTLALPVLQEFYSAASVVSAASAARDLAQLLEQWQRSVAEAPAVTIAEPPGAGGFPGGESA